MPNKEFVPIKRSHAQHGRHARPNRASPGEAQPPLPHRLGLDTRAHTFPRPTSGPLSATETPVGYVRGSQWREEPEERTFSPVDADVSFFGGTGIGHQHQTAPALERHPVLLPIRQPMRQSSARFHPGESHGMTDDPRRAADHLRYAEWTDPDANDQDHEPHNGPVRRRSTSRNRRSRSRSVSREPFRQEPDVVAMRSRREARRREIESGSLHNSRADAQPRTFPSQVPSSPLTSARYVPGDHPFMADDVYQAALHEDMIQPRRHSTDTLPRYQPHTPDTDRALERDPDREFLRQIARQEERTRRTPGPFDARRQQISEEDSEQLRGYPGSRYR